ncbi:hypothetical protein DW352_15565 [Pseudolabrys taiwanensis]|uniref:Uncharacterized protein n=1 Tax=Pseudolabrys taiwanensis TaxID=331696 RepID=A0A345ZY18_9HYPH|nr:hypothetical protein [Pseudolabrys taiwanensis]AXK81815.1 hypothetical protein DW352_15565 [Pseudolabrys taiwanensis]
MNNEELQIFLDSHGTDPSVWPESQRAAVEKFIASSAEARALFEGARRFDALLTRTASRAGADEAAAARVLARLSDLPAQKRPFWHWPLVLLDWQFAPAWPRMAALACCAAVGFGVGIAGLDRTLERYESLQTVTTQTDIASIFEPEALTGARP